MSLSKIYRGEDAANLKSFQYLSFGAEAKESVSDTEKSVEPPAVQQPVAESPVVAGHTAAEVEEAYGRGYREAMEHTGERLEKATQALAKGLDEVSRLRETLARNSQQDMLRLVMTVAEQIIREQAAIDSQVVIKVIENALHEAVRADHYRIFVNPADLAAVTEQKPLFLASISGLKNIHVEADGKISAGGCRVDSEFGNVDATLETQFETIRQALQEALPAS